MHFPTPEVSQDSGSKRALVGDEADLSDDDEEMAQPQCVFPQHTELTFVKESL